MALRRLLEIASDSLGDKKMPDCVHRQGERSPLWPQWLLPLYEDRNGFLAFESALVVLPLSESVPVSFPNVNRLPFWMDSYGFGLGTVVFGMDAFADVFAIDDDGKVFRMNLYTGKVDPIAANLEGWAEVLLSDYNHQTGWSVCGAWQRAHRPIDHRHRLLPRIPFICGGDYTVDNLCAVKTLEGLSAMHDLYLLWRDLPEKATVDLTQWTQWIRNGMA